MTFAVLLFTPVFTVLIMLTYCCVTTLQFILLEIMNCREHSWTPITVTPCWYGKLSDSFLPWVV